MYSITFQARKLVRSIKLEKRRNEAASIIAAYFTGWKVNTLSSVFTEDCLDNQIKESRGQSVVSVGIVD